jgi:hypothetical protein
MLEGWSSIWVTFLLSSPCIMIWQRVLSVFKLDTKHGWSCAAHHNHFQDITILSTKSKYMHWIIREAIQTHLNPSNKNRGEGHVFRRSWKPPTSSQKNRLNLPFNYQSTWLHNTEGFNFQPTILTCITCENTFLLHHLKNWMVAL